MRRLNWQLILVKRIKTDDKKEIRSKLVRKNFSWENVVKKLKKEFENKLSK